MKELHENIRTEKKPSSYSFELPQTWEIEEKKEMVCFAPTGSLYEYDEMDELDDLAAAFNAFEIEDYEHIHWKDNDCYCFVRATENGWDEI